MRIVAGRWRGRQIETPDDDRVRPTTDKIREAWMSIVTRDLPGARVLDLFAGSGALGLEALSRGAERVDFVDQSVRLLTRNVEGLGAGDVARIHRADALQFASTLPAGAYDVAFADPPYALDAARKLAERWLEVPFAALIGIEHESSKPLPPGGETRRYGRTSITFYRTAAT